MNFDEMQVVWDSQNRQQVYAVDEFGLYAIVRRKHEALRSCIFWRDIREIGVGVAGCIGLLFFSWSLGSWDENRWRSLLGSNLEMTRQCAMLMLIASAFFLYYALYHWVARWRGQRREKNYKHSLRGDIERTLAQIAYEIHLARGAVWWALIPLLVGTLLFLYVVGTVVSAPPALWLLPAIVMPVCLILDVRCRQRPIRERLLPLKAEFESLRQKLAQDEP